jgi:hypothetical protein
MAFLPGLCNVELDPADSRILGVSDDTGTRRKTQDALGLEQVLEIAHKLLLLSRTAQVQRRDPSLGPDSVGKRSGSVFAVPLFVLDRQYVRMLQTVGIGEDKGWESYKGGVDELEDWRPVYAFLAFLFLASALAVDAHREQIAHAFRPLQRSGFGELICL